MLSELGEKDKKQVEEALKALREAIGKLEECVKELE